MRDTCEWFYDDDPEYWRTECGNTHRLFGDMHRLFGVTLGDLSRCPYCGKRIYNASSGRVNVEDIRDTIARFMRQLEKEEVLGQIPQQVDRIQSVIKLVNSDTEVSWGYGAFVDWRGYAICVLERMKRIAGGLFDGFMDQAQQDIDHFKGWSREILGAEGIPVKELCCHWIQYDDKWVISCRCSGKQRFAEMGTGPEESRFEYCPYCGGTMSETIEYAE